RWPIRSKTGPRSAQLLLGPGEAIRLQPRYPAPFNRASLSREGRTLAVKTRDGRAGILDLERPNRRLRRIHHPVTSLALSPDACWVATNAAEAFASKLWDAHSGRWVRDFPGMRTARVAFSPDNRWLVFGTAQEYLFYDVGSWKAGRSLP